MASGSVQFRYIHSNLCLYMYWNEVCISLPEKLMSLWKKIIDLPALQTYNWCFYIKCRLNILELIYLVYILNTYPSLLQNLRVIFINKIILYFSYVLTWSVVKIYTCTLVQIYCSLWILPVIDDDSLLFRYPRWESGACLRILW